jgi:hypothetical protein
MHHHFAHCVVIDKSYEFTISLICKLGRIFPNMTGNKFALSLSETNREKKLRVPSPRANYTD